MAKRVRVLDGVRGVALLLVLVFHAVTFSGFTTNSRADAVFNATVKTGWVGVDLFFVLSGFLITGILFDTRYDERYFRTFYVRRFLRIVPVYYAFLIIYRLFAQSMIGAEHAPNLSWRAFAWAASYLSNFPSGAQGWALLPHPLRHVWSLAIEEQFYLFWPLLVFRLPARRLMAVCLGAVIVGWLTRLVLLSLSMEIAAYIWTPARLGPLALGAYVALALRDPRHLGWLTRWAPRLAMVMLIVVLGVFAWRRNLSYSEPITQLAVFDPLAIMFAAFIAIAVIPSPNGYFRRFLGHPALAFLGRYSYAMYLVHQPLILMFRHAGLSASILPPIGGSHWPGAVAFVLICAASTVAVSLASWHLLEKPCARLKARFEYTSLPAYRDDQRPVIENQPANWKFEFTKSPPRRRS